MIKEIYFEEFHDDFMGGMYKNNFTYDGLKALYDYLENYEESTGEPLKFDIVCIACDYTEYEDLAELQQNYTSIENMEELEDRTLVIKIEDSERFIIVNF